MAMTAWSANVSSSSICLSVNGPASCRATRSTPIGRALPEHRHARGRSGASAPRRSPSAYVGIAPRRRGCATTAPRGWPGPSRPRGVGQRMHAAPGPRGRPARVAVARRHAMQLAVDAERRADVAPHSRAALSTIVVEHRLDVGRRAADDPQDLAGRRLLLERLGEIAVARLELLEQAHVLDGDHRLVGEGLQERDLLVGERPDLARRIAMTPMRAPSRSSGIARMRPDAARRVARPSDTRRSASTSWMWMIAPLERPRGPSPTPGRR